LACTAHPPPTAAGVATTAKVAAMPVSMGRPLLTNGLSDRANRPPGRPVAATSSPETAQTL
jgi:hypothetical protein